MKSLSNYEFSNPEVLDVNQHNCIGKIAELREVINEAVSKLPSYCERWKSYNSMLPVNQ